MRAPVTALLLVLFGSLPTCAADRPKGASLSPEQARAGWLTLFDGATTFGWKVEGDARVENGALILGGDKPTRASFTSAFGEFEFELEYSCQGKANQSDLLIQDARGKTFRARLASPAGRVHAHTPEGSLQHLTVAVAEGDRVAISSLRVRPAGMKPIFAGKDLTGWHVINDPKRKPASVFSVTDKGELNVKNGPGDLQTDGQWDDFVLQADVFSNGPHLNSGIFFRSLPGEFWSGYEAQIRNEWITDVTLTDGTKLAGSYTLKGDKVAVQIYTEQNGRWRATKDVKTVSRGQVKEVVHHRDQPIDYGTGALYNRVPARKVVSDDFEWFTMTVIAQGNHIAIWVNGYQTVDFTDTRPANRSGRNGSKTDKGPISIQGHDPTTDLSFRNIRIAELPR